MSADQPARAVLVGRDLVLGFDADGTLVDAVHPTAGPWLARSGEVEVTSGGETVPLGRPVVGVDADEVEVERTGGGLRVLVRHAVEQAWTVRLVVVNESSDERVLDDVRLAWRPAPGTVATALAAGAAGAYAVQPVTGDGPLLVGRLRGGTQAGVDATGLLLGRLVLPAGHRVAVQWRWEVVGAPARADPAGELPRTPWLEQGQGVVLAAGPDVAVVAPGLEVEVGEDSVEVTADVVGPATVELRSARGTLSYALAWAPDLDELVDAEVEALLTGRTTPAGTVRLPDAAAALLVQDAVRRRSVGTPDVAADALELAAGVLAEEVDEQARGAGATGSDPLALALLAREPDRAAGPATLAGLETASAGLLAAAAPAPGMGLAGVAVALARLRAGLAPDRVAAHLAALRDASSPLDEAGLELAVLLRPPGADEPLLAGLRRLGATLGAGLPGRVLPEPSLEPLGRAATLLALVDEPTGQRLRRGWGVSASELARRSAAQVRARVDAAPEEPASRRALAWLVLGRPPG
ncbi:hypothetical protein [Microlunatus flavus]|uniref:Uncharacterized protein n=1 Tax=Microlunatus flavus TaxID=1036181 RepID=A0A1H9CWY8_9ACTN|nr:hypothetical protein [Microlunatus flavus]SEQ05113.1 hypothetical protein SAMN05421756_102339 [Microlunatus flavus]